MVRKVKNKDHLSPVETEIGAELGKNDKNCQKSSKVKAIDAFEKIMSTNGVGDTPKKTPKRKPKRISLTKSTGKNRNVLEKWLDRANKM